MYFIRILRLSFFQVACAFLLLAAGIQASPRSRSSSKQSGNGDDFPENHSMSNHDKKQLEDELDVFGTEEVKNGELPILPPIILLDFVNTTSETSPNSTHATEEKPKRAIDGSFGYGFNNQNSLFSSKHNYYFPSDTGTAVNIEESMSPFEISTTTENVKPITEANENEKDATTAKPPFEALPDPLPFQYGREKLQAYPPYPVFGQRTKLQKSESPLDFGSSKQPSTKPSQNIYNKLLATYSSMRPETYQPIYPTSANIQGYVRPMTSINSAGFMTVPHASDSVQPIITRPDLNRVSTRYYNPYSMSQPKYTIENGIKYEHKVVWKYPDGRYSESPPSSYSTMYNVNGQKEIHTMDGGFRPSIPFNPSSAFSDLGQEKPSQPPKPTSNINSPKPIQFPDDQEEPDTDKETTTPTVLIGQSSKPNIHQPATFFQGQYGLRQNPKPGNFKTTISHQGQSSLHSQQPVVEYTINTYSPSLSTGNHKELFTPSGQLSGEALGKYTLEAQNYLKKVFSSANPVTHHTSQSASGNPYSSTGYHNLLNRNPSLSQYIKNPASILNAQPTFIQAGNSLIPVIILKVDGAPPLKSKSSSNINLKSLLQQYLMQYADSVSKYTQNTNYDFGESMEQGSERVSFNADPVEDLKYLTQTLRKREQQADGQPLRNSHPQSVQPQQHPSLVGQKYSSHDVRNNNSYKPSPRTEIKKPLKVKNVQIVEDR
ncbi:hypothetical protein QAD02_008686 [Eretmocerus hayati]|uniref:Uncharacterized protein n=1 Tax=Eretmocerus hayati TaxID=131215 RepID=A0ACC2N9K4_9HYME|nr:hypothetical protein QAD02_008686 [Eretmocerus hayati]